MKKETHSGGCIHSQDVGLAVRRLRGGGHEKFPSVPSHISKCPCYIIIHFKKCCPVDNNRHLSFSETAFASQKPFDFDTTAMINVMTVNLCSEWGHVLVNSSKWSWYCAYSWVMYARINLFLFVLKEKLHAGWISVPWWPSASHANLVFKGQSIPPSLLIAHQVSCWLGMCAPNWNHHQHHWTHRFKAVLGSFEDT